MTGRAIIEVDGLVADMLRHRSDVTIEKSACQGGDIWWLTVTSPLLPDGCKGHQELVMTETGIRFKPWADV
jgi:hypothetical protein